MTRTRRTSDHILRVELELRRRLQSRTVNPTVVLVRHGSHQGRRIQSPPIPRPYTGIGQETRLLLWTVIKSSTQHQSL